MDPQCQGMTPPSPPFNPMDTFLDDLPQPALDIKDTIHGDISEFHLPTLSSPLLLLQDVGPGYTPPLSLGNEQMWWKNMASRRSPRELYDSKVSRDKSIKGE